MSKTLRNLTVSGLCPVNGFANYFMAQSANFLEGYKLVESNEMGVEGYEVSAELIPAPTNSVDPFCVPVYGTCKRGFTQFWYGDDEFFKEGEKVPVAYLPQHLNELWDDAADSDREAMSYLEYRRLVSKPVKAILHHREVKLPLKEVPVVQNWVSFKVGDLDDPRTAKNLDRRRKYRIIV